MNADKKSFMFYLSWFESIESLDESTQIQLFSAIMRYAFYGEVPKLNPFLMFGFNEIKAQIDRDNSKWEDKREKRRQAGILGNQKRWGLSQNVAKIANAKTESQNVAKIAVDVDADVDVDVDVDADVDVTHKMCVCDNNKRTPTLEMCIQYAESKGYTSEQAEKFYYFQDGIGWDNVNNWKSKLTYWCKKDGPPSLNTGTHKTIQEEEEEKRLAIREKSKRASKPKESSEDLSEWMASNGYKEMSEEVLAKYKQHCINQN